MEISSSSGIASGSANFLATSFLGASILNASATTTASVPTDTVLLDTNVLVYAYNADSEHHAACRALLDRAVIGTQDVCISPQVLFEFFAVVTNPAKSDQPITTAVTLDEMAKLSETIAMIIPPSDIHTLAIQLMRKLGFGSKHIYDVVLAATMLANGVTKIYTYDERFKKNSRPHRFNAIDIVRDARTSTTQSATRRFFEKKKAGSREAHP